MVFIYPLITRAHFVFQGRIPQRIKVGFLGIFLMLFFCGNASSKEVGEDLDGSSVASNIKDMQKVYEETFNDYFVGKVAYPKWFKQSDFMNYQDDLSDALDDDKKGMFFLFTTQGCPYCDKFIKLSLGDPKIAELVQKGFTSTGMEIFSDVDITDFKGNDKTAKDFAKAEGVQFTPTMVFYGENGEKLFQAIGYQDPERFKHILAYVAGGHYTSQTILEYVKEHRKNTYAPTTADKLIEGLYEKAIADRIFDESAKDLSRDAKESRPLFLLFEEDNCQDCVDFHENILPVRKVRHLLKKFQVVKFDANDTKTKLIKPNKDKTTAAQWIKDLNIQKLPALVFFDGKGRQVLKTDSVIRQRRMVYSLKYVLDNAFDKGWTYQRYGRSQEIAKRQAALKEEEGEINKADTKLEKAEE